MLIKQQSLTFFACLMTLNGCVSHHLNPTHEASADVRLGVAYLQQGDREKARQILTQALHVAPKNAVAWSAMAYLDELTGKIQLAAHEYRQSIRLSPNNGDLRNNYGAFLCRHQQARAGIREFMVAVQLPNYIYRANAYENAGLCALNVPDPLAAKTYFEAARLNGYGWT